MFSFLIEVAIFTSVKISYSFIKRVLLYLLNSDKMKKLILHFILIVTPSIFPQSDTTLVQKLDSLLNYNENLEHRLSMLDKYLHELMLFQKVEDVPDFMSLSSILL
ncbi:MAG: family peptidase [Bacteroidota bacterium]|nr:family peptidase [Bacteroidota bacterium]